MGKSVEEPLTNEQLLKIRELFELGMGTRKIGQNLGLGRHMVKKAFR
jgi:hypothetical protein